MGAAPHVHSAASRENPPSFTFLFGLRLAADGGPRGPPGGNMKQSSSVEEACRVSGGARRGKLDTAKTLGVVLLAWGRRPLVSSVRPPGGGGRRRGRPTPTRAMVLQLRLMEFDALIARRTPAHPAASRGPGSSRRRRRLGARIAPPPASRPAGRHFGPSRARVRGAASGLAAAAHVRPIARREGVFPRGRWSCVGRCPLSTGERAQTPLKTPGEEAKILTPVASLRGPDGVPRLRRERTVYKT